MLTIHVDGSLEERIKLAAASRGDDPTVLAREVLDRNLPEVQGKVEVRNQLAAIELFIAGMTEWVSKHVPPGQFADDDRASLYQGRGE